MKIQGSAHVNVWKVSVYPNIHYSVFGKLKIWLMALFLSSVQLHKFWGFLRIFVSKSFIVTICIASPTWFLRKKLSSNFVNQLYSTHFLQQLPGRLFKISADRSGAYYKEGAWSRGTIIKKLLTLIKKQVCFLSKKIRIKELGPQEGKGAGFIQGGRSKRNKTRLSSGKSLT